MRKTILHLTHLSILSFLFSLSAFSQTGTIQGTVKDTNGLPLQGASVVLQGTRYGARTDASGAYSLQAPAASYTIIASFAGMLPQRSTLTVTAGSVVDHSFVLQYSNELAQVVITGSRSATARSRLQSPVPVDVIPVSEVVNEVGQVDLNQILTYVAPSFQSSRQTISDGTDHLDPAQLRGLGPDQVLVLLNGKRRHQSSLVNVNGTVNRGTVGTDLGAIPASAVERIEILRDGAAAQYGSDAIAGVVNIILKKKTGVLEAGVSYGMYNTSYDKNYALHKLNPNATDASKHVSDGETFQASLGYGFKIGRGVLHLTGEYIHRNPTNRTGTYTGQIYAPVGGVSKDDSILQARGLNRNSFDMRIGNSGMKGGAAFYNFSLPFNNRTTLYAFGGASTKKGDAAGFYRYPDGIVTNAKKYAPAVFDIYPEGFLPEIKSDILDVSTSVGLRTKFGEWNAELSNTFGINRFDFTVDQSTNYTQFVNAGNRQTSFDAGGTKFWQNTVNADVSRKFNVLEGLNVAAGLEYRVDAFGLNKGEEASYKNFDTASKAQEGAQVFAGFINGLDETRNAKAVYLDLEQDITDKLLVTGALRFEHFSDFGSTLNYKFSARYTFSDIFSLRASTSTGFRAPSMQQRFYTKRNTVFVSQGGTLVQVESGTFTNDSKVAEVLGIPKLKEETSRSYSAGFTAKPFPGLEFTVDAYQIDIDDRIILTNNFTGGNSQVLKEQLAAAGATTANVFANAIDTRSRGLEAVLSYRKNFGRGHSLRTILAATFIDNKVKDGPNGKPLIHASDVLINSGQIGNYFNREDESRIEVASPRNKMSLTIDYKFSKFGAMLRLVNFGKVIYLDPGINPDSSHKFPVNAFTGNKETLDQEFSAKLVTDLSLSYQVNSNLSVIIGANNLFNVYQDKHTHSGNFNSGRFIYSRRVQQMGFNGAYYFARLTLAVTTKKESSK